MNLQINAIWLVRICTKNKKLSFSFTLGFLSPVCVCLSLPVSPFLFSFLAEFISDKHRKVRVATRKCFELLYSNALWKSTFDLQLHHIHLGILTVNLM